MISGKNARMQTRCRKDVILMKVSNALNIEQYILDNIKKAFGHEYRAFFEMADWFTYICRKYVREELSFNSKRKKYEEKYEEKYNDFESVKKFINEVPYMIAEYREKKMLVIMKLF